MIVNYEKEFFLRVKQILGIKKAGDISLYDAEVYLYESGKDKDYPLLKNVLLQLHDKNMTTDEQQEFLKSILEEDILNGV